MKTKCSESRPQRMHGDGNPLICRHISWPAILSLSYCAAGKTSAPGPRARFATRQVRLASNIDDVVMFWSCPHARATIVSACGHARARMLVHSKPSALELNPNETRKQVRAKRNRASSALAVQALGEYKGSRRHARGAERALSPVDHRGR